MAAAAVAVASASYHHQTCRSSSCSGTTATATTRTFTSSESSSSSSASSCYSILSSSTAKKPPLSGNGSRREDSREAVVVTVASRCIKYVRGSEGGQNKTSSSSSLSLAHPTPPCLPLEKWLCPSSRVPLQLWRETRRNGAGLINPHALCFMNAVLQALAYTPGFAEDLLEGRHSRLCPVAQSKKRAFSASSSSGTSLSHRSPESRPTTSRANRAGPGDVANGDERLKARSAEDSPKLSSSSSSTAKDDVSFSFCALCKLEEQVRSIHRQSGGCVENRFSACVRQFIWKRFRPGRQEDAHEFLRYLLDALIRAQAPPSTSSSTASKKEAPPEVWMTSYCGQLFGGWLQSSIRCSQCTYSSVRFDACLDVPVDLGGRGGGGGGAKARDGMGFKSRHEKRWMKKNKKLLNRTGEGGPGGKQGVYTLEKALQRFVEKEYLAGDNCYNCPQCKKKQPATKQMQIHSPPRILVLPIKRFAVESLTGGGGFLNAGLFGGSFLMKNHTALSFPSVLNLAPYMSCVQQYQPSLSSSLSSFLSRIEEKEDSVEGSRDLPLTERKKVDDENKDGSSLEGDTCSTRASSSSLSPSLSPVSSSSPPTPSEVSSVSSSPPLYQLYAVVTHSGASLTSGHYRCYVRAPAAGLLEASSLSSATTEPSSASSLPEDRPERPVSFSSSSSSWLMIDDEVVRLVSEATVVHRLQQEAYLLFYSRIPSPQQILEMTRRLQRKAGRLDAAQEEEEERRSGPRGESQDSVDEEEEETGGSLLSQGDQSERSTSESSTTSASEKEMSEEWLSSEESLEEDDSGVSSSSCFLSEGEDLSSEDGDAADFFQAIFSRKTRGSKDRRRRLWHYLMRQEEPEGRSLPRCFFSRKLRQHMKLLLGACRSKKGLRMRRRREFSNGTGQRKSPQQPQGVCHQSGVRTPEKSAGYDDRSSDEDLASETPSRERRRTRDTSFPDASPRCSARNASPHPRHASARKEREMKPQRLLEKKKRKIDMNRPENSKTVMSTKEGEIEESKKEGKAKAAEQDSLRNFHVVTPEEMRERIAAARSYSRQFGPRATSSWSDSEEEAEEEEVEEDGDPTSRKDKDDRLRAFERLQELQQPKSAKRSRHDREYDRGKVKKVKRKEPKPTVGASVSHSPSSSSSDPSFVVHQRAAFDQVLAEKQNKGRRFQPRLPGDGNKKKFSKKKGRAGGRHKKAHGHQHHGRGFF